MGYMSDFKKQKWNFAGSATGVFIAVVLSKTIDPTIAWFIGGSIMGGIMVFLAAQKRSGLLRVGVTLVAGLAAAVSHYAVTRLI